MEKKDLYRRFRDDMVQVKTRHEDLDTLDELQEYLEGLRKKRELGEFAVETYNSELAAYNDLATEYGQKTMTDEEIHEKFDKQYAFGKRANAAIKDVLSKIDGDEGLAKLAQNRSGKKADASANANDEVIEGEIVDDQSAKEGAKSDKDAGKAEKGKSDYWSKVKSANLNWAKSEDDAQPETEKKMGLGARLGAWWAAVQARRAEKKNAKKAAREDGAETEVINMNQFDDNAKQGQKYAEAPEQTIPEGAAWANNAANKKPSKIKEMLNTPLRKFAAGALAVAAVFGVGGSIAYGVTAGNNEVSTSQTDNKSDKKEDVQSDKKDTKKEDSNKTEAKSDEKSESKESDVKQTDETQAAADKLGVSKSDYQKYADAAKAYQISSPEMVKQLADYYGVPADKLGTPEAQQYMMDGVWQQGNLNEKMMSNGDASKFKDDMKFVANNNPYILAQFDAAIDEDGNTPDAGLDGMEDGAVLMNQKLASYSDANVRAAVQDKVENFLNNANVSARPAESRLAYSVGTYALNTLTITQPTEDDNGHNAFIYDVMGQDDQVEIKDGCAQLNVYEYVVPQTVYTPSTPSYTPDVPTTTVTPPTQTPPTETPPTETPPTSNPPETPPETIPPETQPPVTQPPVTQPPVTQPPVTQPPVTQPPVTEPPVTQPPVESKDPTANDKQQNDANGFEDSAKDDDKPQVQEPAPTPTTPTNPSTGNNNQYVKPDGNVGNVGNTGSTTVPKPDDNQGNINGSQPEEPGVSEM